MNSFYEDVFSSLSAPVKTLESKYFYDAAGDRLFEQIMASPEYYLTNCELEILSETSSEIIQAITAFYPAFDVVELGAGNAMKSGFFLKEMKKRSIPFTYFPVDISQNVISLLEEKLPLEIPGLRMHTLNGEYIDMLQKASALSTRNKLVLFLGSNVGNFSTEQARNFFRKVREQLNPGDMILTGFDLAKNPATILAAYNDRLGVTKAFNFNLLKRINRELDADFKPEQFDHYPSYDPGTGACKSFLVSLQDQVVRIGEADFIFFKEGETIQTEISHKYRVDQVEQLADKCGYELVDNFYDSKKWFVDSLWKA